MIRGRLAAGVGVLAAATALAWSPVLLNHFAWDDLYLVVQNPAIEDLSNVPGLFARSWANDVGHALGQAQNRPYYRPMALASMALDWAIAGPDPRVFHAVNLLVHLLGALALWRWLARILPGARDGGEGRLPLLLAAAWALHPVHSEAVALVSYRTTLLSGAFLFAALWALTPRPGSRTGAAGVVAGTLCFAGGLLSKETTLVLPGLLLAWDVLAGRLDRRRVAAVYLPLGISGIVWLALRSQVTAAGALPSYFEGLTAIQAALMVPRVFFLYVRLAVLPHPLCPFYDWTILGAPTSPLEPDVLAGLALMVAMIAAVILLRRRAPVAAFGLSFFLVALLPVSHLVPFFDAAGDRFLYVPLAGLLVAIGAGVRALPATPVLRGLAVALAIVALAGGGALSARRAAEWRDSETILRATARDFPRSLSAHLGLARLLLDGGRPDEAAEPLRQVVRLAPSLAVGHALLSVSLARQGDVTAARHVLMAAPPPPQGLPSAPELAREELMKTGDYAVLQRMGL